jgi:hypothetical protein
MMRIAYALALIVSVGLVAACSKSDCLKDLTGLQKEAPCLNRTEADDGGAVGKPQCYVEPQICPGLGAVSFCSRPVGQSRRESVEITNTGEGDLVISSIRMRGDTDCVFVEPELRNSDGGVPMTVKPQETVLFSFRFTPITPGARSDAEIDIESNAQNVPVLTIWVCGMGVSSDAGVAPIEDGGVQQCGPNDELRQCQDRTSAAFTQCGPGWVALAGPAQ